MDAYPELEYPMVVCEDQACQPRPGYMVCPHIHEAKDVGFLDMASQHSLGVACCYECSITQNVTSEWSVTCGHCLVKRGILTSALPS